MEQIKQNTWQQIKDFINTLSEEELTQPAFVLVDDSTKFTPLYAPARLQGDIYVNIENDDDSGPLEALRELHEEDFNIQNYRLSTKKGTPFLWADNYLDKETESFEFYSHDEPN